MNHRKPDEPPPEEWLDPERLPRVAFFLATYLDREAPAGHGSAARAAFDYAAEAELDELEELEGEWQVVRAAARALPLARLNALLRIRFGTPWQAASTEEIEAVGLELERALRE